MFRPIIILAVLAVYLVSESSCQGFIQPTYRLPKAPKRPIIFRARREVDDEPLWLNKGDIPRAPATGDHPFLPKYIDDIKLDPHQRVVRSYGAPGGSRRGTGTRQSSNHDTGATHPGYNRRNARDVRLQSMWPTLPPFNPQLPGPKYPWDTNPTRLPIYV